MHVFTFQTLVSLTKEFLHNHGGKDFLWFFLNNFKEKIQLLIFCQLITLSFEILISLKDIFTVFRIEQ